MNFLALAVAILNLYAPVSGYSKTPEGLNTLQMAALIEVENDISAYIEGAMHFRLSDKFKSELSEFLRDHGVNNSCNCKFLEIFLTNKVFDEMVETTIDMYKPVADMASHYEELGVGGKIKVSCREKAIISALERQYNFSFDINSRGDFVALIRKCGSDSEANRELLRRFFSCTKTGLFENIAKFIKPAESRDNIRSLRRTLQSNPNIFRFYNPQKREKNKARCGNLAVHRWKGVCGGKKI